MARQITAERRAAIVGRTPMGGFVALDEIARLVPWLCADDCSFSTGGIFDTSGGRATHSAARAPETGFRASRKNTQVAHIGIPKQSQE